MWYYINMGNRILFLPIIGTTTFFILLLLFTRLFGPIPFSVNSITTQKSDTFQVSGDGMVEVKPDVALVTVGVSANGPTVKAAQDQLNGAINKVSQAIKQLGVDDKDIKTTNYNINPTYDYLSGSQRITGYTSSSNLSIKVRQIDKANAVIDAATQSGANQVGGVSFDVDNKDRAENEAREKAVSEAKKKAEQAAKIAGFKLGRIINYQENFGGYPVPLPYALGTAESKVPTPQTQVEPGSTELRVTVTLSFEIL